MDNNCFERCMYAIPLRLRAFLEKLPESVKSETQEIRIRNNLPLALTLRGKPLFLLEDGQTSFFSGGAVICNQNDINECFELLTKHSVYAHTDEIKNGFIRMDYGNRAGICGSFSNSGMIFDISGINIRIAREIIGCSEGIYKKCVGGILVLGAPGSGKTTVIRDLIRMKSNDGKRVAVIDSRGEIAASNYGISPYDLGKNTDTYIIANKALGIEMALRTLYPNVIAFDEIGNSNELSAVKESFNAGVEIITSGHIGSYEEIGKRELIRALIQTRAIKTVVLLPEIIGKEIIILNSEEIKNAF